MVAFAFCMIAFLDAYSMILSLGYQIEFWAVALLYCNLAVIHRIYWSCRKRFREAIWSHLMSPCAHTICVCFLCAISLLRSSNLLSCATRQIYFSLLFLFDLLKIWNSKRNLTRCLALIISAIGELNLAPIVNLKCR